MKPAQLSPGGPSDASNPSTHSRAYSVRPRRIPPEFCTDELLEECSVLSALLLYRLISQADDQGRLPGHAKYIKAICLGMRPDISVRKVDASLDELAAAGFLIRYDIAKRVYLQIHRWHDLQGKWSQRRNYPSRYPAPPGYADDWITVEPPSSEPEPQSARTLPAEGAQDARIVPPPSSFSSSSTSTPTVARLGRAGPAPGRPTHVRDVLRNGTETSKDDALRMGMQLLEPRRR